ncbi:MAG TPA: glycogen/starch/alpha-glucan phosphorylase [Steroidobacteraceae bacterium]|nr:glycogen/starch/alpha-glucan phosphorylase [Steroidobacteraceae bacterium]
MRGVPYDRPVFGYGARAINTLRLWEATSPDYFDLNEFNPGDFFGDPALASLLTEAIGLAWVTNLGELGRLRSVAEDAGFRARFRAAKAVAKQRCTAWPKSSLGTTVDPASIFDSQIKGIHEYERQLLNVLHVIVLYKRLRATPHLDVPPRTFFFAGKAAPAYARARVYRKGDRYYSQLTAQPPVEVFSESPTEFFATVVAAQISFVTGPAAG